MIHFLISHSISLYCHAKREEMEGRNRDTRERGDTDEEEGKQRGRERNGWQRKR